MDSLINNIRLNFSTICSGYYFFYKMPMRDLSVTGSKANYTQETNDERAIKREQLDKKLMESATATPAVISD